MYLLQIIKNFQMVCFESLVYDPPGKKEMQIES